MKEGSAEEERQLTTAGEERHLIGEERYLVPAGEERAEARARVMMATLRGEEREGERLMVKAAGEERLKMSERQPLESVSLVMRAGERPTGERFSREERSSGERHLKDGRLMGREGEVDSDRGSSVDTTDDSGLLVFKSFNEAE